MANIFDTESRYTVLNTTSIQDLQETVSKSRCTTKSPKMINVISKEQQMNDIKRFINSRRSLMSKHKVDKKLRPPTSVTKQRSRPTDSGFSIIKHKINLMKHPQIYDDKFPELSNLKIAAKIDLSKYKNIRNPQLWGVRNMRMTDNAYHFTGYRMKAKPTKDAPDPKKGAFLKQLAVIQAGAKPTIVTNLVDNVNKNFTKVTSKLLGYLQQTHRNMMNINIQHDFRDLKEF